MKTLEEIEKLSAEELLRKAEDAAPAAPQGLTRRLRESLAAQELLEQAQPRPARWLPYLALAAAAAVTAAVVLLPGSGPRDTFDDPYLAYAEVEKAFQTISDKMSAGVDLAREAQAIADRPQTILDKIQSK